MFSLNVDYIFESPDCVWESGQLKVTTKRRDQICPSSNKQRIAGELFILAPNVATLNKDTPTPVINKTLSCHHRTNGKSI